jgi:hypothetical protein
MAATKVGESCAVLVIIIFLYFELLHPLGRKDMKKCKMDFTRKCISALAIIEYNNKKNSRA